MRILGVLGKRLQWIAPAYNGSGVSIPTRQGREWYVDANGFLNGDGRYDRPMQTIQRAVDRARDFDTIRIFPGSNYVENVVIPDGLHYLSLLAATWHGNAKRVAIAPASGIALNVKAVKGFRCRGIRAVGTSAYGISMAGEGGLFEDCDPTSDTTAGFAFDSSKTTADYTGSGTVIRGGVIRDCGGAGLRSVASEDVAEINYGIQATNVIIDGVQFYTNTGDDIDDDAAAGNPTYFYQWEIVRCKFMTKNKTTYLDMDGSNQGGTDCLIHDNDFATASLDGTKIQKPTNAMFINNRSQTGIETAL